MKSIAVCLINLLVLASAGSAQSSFVEGHVRLADGQSVVGAQVLLFDIADLRRDALVRATTDANGQFALPLAGFDRLSPRLGRSGLPNGFALGANYPNPFNPATVIPYELAVSAQVRLEVFNLLGQRVATLVDGYQAAGAHTAMWTATSEAGQAVSAGVYLYRLVVDGQQQTGRMVLVDGQAGVAVAAGPGRPAVVGSMDAGERSYGLAVLGVGLAPYVDTDFRVDAGPVAVVVEPGALQPRGKGLGTAGDELDNLFAMLDAFITQAPQTEGDDTEAEEAVADTSAAGFVDLVADSLWVDPSEVMPGRSFVLNARILNQGTELADSTMAHFYRSNNAKITSEDRLLGSAQVDGLAGKDTSTVSIELTAPLEEGMYWYGACVDALAGELYATNNCSAAVQVTVAHSADLAVTASVSSGVASQRNNIFPQVQSFTLSVMVSNLGTGTAPLTTMHYYSSADSTIGSDDTEIGIASVSSLAGEDARQYSLALSAPAETGTYYYGACVVSVAGEHDTDNNCSSGVRVIVIEQASGTSGTSGTGGTGGTGGDDGDGGTGGYCDTSGPPQDFPYGSCECPPPSSPLVTYDPVTNDPLYFSCH